METRSPSMLRITQADMVCATAETVLPRIGDPLLARLLRDWMAWRGHRALPARADFQPEDLRYLLGRLFLFDVVQAGDAGLRFRYRLFGSQIAAYRGYDLTGKFIDEHPDPDFAGRAQLAYLRAIAEASPLWAKIDGVSSSGQQSRFEALILPLAGDGAKPDMVLSAQIMDEA